MKSKILIFVILTLVAAPVLSLVILSLVAQTPLSAPLASEALSIRDAPIPTQIMVGVVATLFGVLSLAPFFKEELETME